MSESPNKSFNLRWNQHNSYIISLTASHPGDIPAPIAKALESAGMRRMNNRSFCVDAPQNWKAMWDNIYTTLAQIEALEGLQATIIPASESLEYAEYRALSGVQMIADSLWLGDALLEDRVMCYLQPVVDTRGQVFGYESFARARSNSGDIIAGDRIIAASRALNIEYVIDRHLHVQAIRTFVSSSFNGFLFVNLFPDFIHRPEIYLEGLSETAKKLGIVPKHIVLDVMHSESMRDTLHIKSVCEYARSRGMSIALDDIETLAGARKLVSELRPDFLKLDRKLTHRAAEAGPRDAIRQMVSLVHEHGGSVIAEGIETDEIRKELEPLGVDLYQGYLFSPPMPVEAALKQATS